MPFHTKSIHEGLRYPCGQCEYEATQKGSLKIHIKSMHHKEDEDEKKYACDQCDYRAGVQHRLIDNVHRLSTLSMCEV